MPSGKIINESTVAVAYLPDGRETVIGARFFFDTNDPYAITLVFQTGDDQEVTWVFARDLLDAGLDVRTGDGDVSIGPDPANFRRTRVVLSSPHGHAEFGFLRTDLTRFLARTYEHVGSEYVLPSQRIDAELSVLGLLRDGTEGVL